MYRKVFNEQYNFSFHPPSKELHLSKAELAYDQKSKDKAYAAASDDCVTASFDLQKVLPSPHLKTGVVYYKREF